MRRVRRNQDGVVAVFMLMAVVALMGMVGFVIDMGQIRQEKRELQNGADAAALALAQECARNLCTNLMAKAQPYADANAKDRASAVTGATLISANQVKVDTRTTTSGGATSLTMQFIQFVGGPTTAQVKATATAAWEAPGGATTFPLTISYCEWNSLVTSSGGIYPTSSQWIYFHNPKNNPNQNPPICPSGPAGQNVPGGFGWLDTVSNSVCATAVVAGSNVSSAPGNSPPNLNNSGCVPASFLSANTITIPVFDAASGSGQNGQYHIFGLATFEMFHMHLAGGNCSSSAWNTCNPPAGCSSSQRCIYGRFVLKIFPCPCTGTAGPPLGTLAVKLVA